MTVNDFLQISVISIHTDLIWAPVIIDVMKFMNPAKAGMLYTQYFINKAFTHPQKWS